MIIKKMLERIRTAAPYRNPLMQLVDIVWHKLKINTHPADYYYFEFYKKDKTWEEKKGYISRYGSYYWPYDSIFIRDMSVLTDKYINKHMLLGMGLPTAELLAAVGNDYEVRNLEELEARLPSWKYDLIIKPISGAGGSNVFALNWDNGHFLGPDGKRWPASRIWEQLSHHLDVGWLIERRIFNVGRTREIYPGAFNSFRVITIRTEDGKWHVPAHMLKFGCGENVVDNIDAGGILVFMDDRGMAVKAMCDNFRRSLSHHPDTGLPMTGFYAEGFEEVIALAVEASKKFALFGTIGWDIGFTADGPMILEGNTLWGTNFQRFSGPIVRGKLAQGLKSRSAFSRYSRIKAFPAMQRKPRWPWTRTRWWV